MFENNTIELIKQVGAVAFIAILMTKQNNKNFDRLFTIIDKKFTSVVDKLDDIWHKQENTYMSCEDLADYFSDISESHKLKKFKVLVKCFENYKQGSIDLESLTNDIKNQFKTITKKEVQKLNKIKSKTYNKDLGDKFYKKIDWDKYIPETINILCSSSSISEIEDRFFSLTDNYLIAIRTSLKI